MRSRTTNDTIDFEKLVDDYYASLYRFAYSLSGNEADAWDLTQQTFSRWAEKGHTLRDASKVKSWLFTTLYREFLKWNRQSKNIFSIDDTPAGEERHSVPAEVVDRTDASALLDMLAEIDEVYRAPLSLFYLEDMTYKEIAALLEIPTGTVMSRLSRGKALLRKRIFSREGETSAGADSSPAGQSSAGRTEIDNEQG